LEAPHVPDPDDYQTVMGFHARGSILVAAVFDAFLMIYHHRIAALRRIATGGTGVLPLGDLHPDLVEAMAQVAAKTARDVLRICIRALDYCPPVDITFGDYLRALVTADYDMVAPATCMGTGSRLSRLFRKRGIRASGIRSLAVEDLLHPLHPPGLSEPQEKKFGLLLRKIKETVGYSDRPGRHLREDQRIHPRIPGTSSVPGVEVRGQRRRRPIRRADRPDVSRRRRSDREAGVGVCLPDDPRPPRTRSATSGWPIESRRTTGSSTTWS
jgi:hypothetical protein